MTLKEVLQVSEQKADIAGSLNAGDGTSGAPVIKRARCDAEIGGGLGLGEKM